VEIHSLRTIDGKQLGLTPRMAAIFTELWGRRGQIDGLKKAKVVIDLGGKNVRVSVTEYGDPVEVGRCKD